MWFALAQAEPDCRWREVTLLWCDSVISAVAKLLETASLMIDGVYFDVMRVVPIGGDVTPQRLLGKEVSLGKMIRNKPYEFLFDKTSSLPKTLSGLA